LLRALLAACVALAPLSVALSFVADPTGGVPHGASNTYVTYREAGAERVEVFLVLNAAAAYLFPMSYTGLGLVALRRAPWLAPAACALARPCGVRPGSPLRRAPWLAAPGMIAGLLGTLQWAVFVPVETLFAVMAQAPNGGDFIQLANAISAEGVIGALQLAWVLGHLLGYTLLGVPLQALPYPLNLGAFQIAGFLLIFLGSILAALALLRYDPTNQ
jgi:hypothetical protein